MPSGILHSPFFDVTFPAAINFGSIGLILGHEIAHGFDRDGQEYDRDGNKRKWMKKETGQGFQQRAYCFVYQQSTYPNKGIMLALWTNSKYSK